MSLQYREELAIGAAATDEFEKIALNLGGIAKAMLTRGTRASKAVSAKGAQTGRLVGAGVTGAGGAATGYATAPDDESRTGRAILGGLLGAGVGLGAGQLATRAGRGEVKRFGQRQLHGFTGYLPGKGLKATHTMDPKDRVKALREMKWVIPKAHPKDTGKAVENLKQRIAKDRGEGTGVMKAVGGTSLGKKWDESKLRDLLLRNRIRTERAQTALAEQGLTSIPGVARGYAVGKSGKGIDMTRIQQLKANLAAPGLALGVGLPAASLIGSGINTAQTGDTRQLGRDVVDTAGFAAFAGLPLVPAIAVGQGLSSGAGLLLGKSPQQQQQVPAAPGAMSPSAQQAFAQARRTGQVVR